MRTWIALLGEPAHLVSWRSDKRPHPDALSIDPRAVGSGGPPMTVSWCAIAKEQRPLFDAPEVLEARRVLMRDWPAYGASALVGDSSHLAGGLTLHPLGTVDPANPLAGGRRCIVLDVDDVLLPVPAPTGPTLERYAGAPWPYDRF